MYYKVVEPIKTKNNRTYGYKLRNGEGNIIFLTNDQIKQKIHSGIIIDGLKIDKSNRLIMDKKHSKLSRYGDIAFMSCRDITVKNGISLVKYSNALSNEYKPRWFVKNIVNYSLDDNPYNRICVLHGVRRTGKTISILKSISILHSNGVPANKLYLISINNENVDFVMLIDIISKIEDAIVFIDEITFINDIIKHLKYISDVVSPTNRLKIIIAGTDSYVFPIANTSTLFGRTYTYHSTAISYSEYKKLFGDSQNLYNRYISDGSLFSQDYSTNTSLIDTVNSITIKNIANTLLRNKEYISNLSGYTSILKYSEIELSFLIYSVLTSTVTPRKKETLNKTIKKLGIEKVKFISRACGVEANKIPNIMTGIKNDDLITILNAMSELDIIKRVENMAVYFIDEDNPSDNKYEAITDEELCVVIPGLLNCMLKAMRCNKDTSDGIITENTVLSNLFTIQLTNNNYNGYSIFDIGYLKYRMNNKDCSKDSKCIIEHEVDAIVAVCKDGFISHHVLIEIKHSNRIKPEFIRHIISDDMPSKLKQSHRINIVVYLGKTTSYNGVMLINIVDFISNPWRYLI